MIQEMVESELWNQWLKNKNEEIANRLIEHYINLVDYHVERISFNVPSNVRREDLESYALMGLYDAIQKFEPRRNLKFVTYASYRIHGAIIDGLRQEDWLPRTLRDKIKKVEAVSERLEQKLHRLPKAEEVAKELEMTTKEVEAAVQHSLFSNVLSIDQYPKGEKDEEVEEVNYAIKDQQSIKPEEYMVQQDSYHTLAEEIKRLNKNEQKVISLFYFDELTMTEIGEVLDLTTSRISQIHKSALFKLQNSLKSLIE